jgi:signal transduction histidine kinase
MKMVLQGVAKRNRIVVPLAWLAALAMIVFSETTYWHSRQTMDDLVASGASRVAIQRLTANMVNAESAQRGYVLTGRKELLQHLALATGTVAQSFEQLTVAFAGDPESTAALAGLRRAIDLRLSVLAQAVALKDQGHNDEAVALVMQNVGTMEAIQALDDDLLKLEDAGRQARRDTVYQALMQARVGVAILAILALMSLLMYLRQARALGQQQHALKTADQIVRERLEIEVAQRTAELTDLTRYLLNTREDERSRLARNLHDDLGALLTSAKLDAARIKSRLEKTAPETLELLAHLVATLNSSVALGRDIIENLRPSALSNLGLVATLEILAREFADNSNVKIQCDLQAVALNEAAALMVYRLVQEALTNISKYARASRVWINLATRGDQVHISVRDDGAGFDPKVKTSSSYGLVGMRFRVEAEGGILNVASTPGQGTLVEACLPQSVQAQALVDESA